MASPKPKVGDTVRRVGRHMCGMADYENRECAVGSVGVVDDTGATSENVRVRWRSHGPDTTRSPGNSSYIHVDGLEVVDPGRRRVEVGDRVEYTGTTGVQLKDRTADRALIPVEGRALTAEAITENVVALQARKDRALRPFAVALDTLGRLATDTVELPDDHSWLVLKDAPVPVITVA
jgi:hypothetical protein